MKHSINELYRVQGTTKLITEEANSLLHIPTHRALSYQHKGDAVTVIDVDSTKTIYMFGEKTWFDTQEELNEHRAQYQAEMNARKERKKIMDALIAEFDRMPTEKLRSILEDMFGVV
jgi:hypothetical protein